MTKYDNLLLVMSELTGVRADAAIDTALAALIYEQPLCFVVTNNIDLNSGNMIETARSRFQNLKDMGLQEVLITHAATDRTTLPIRARYINSAEFRSLICQHTHMINF